MKTAVIKKEKDLVNEKKSRLIQLVSQFSDEKLDEDYKNICIHLIEKMSRKRDVPFLLGRLEIWAAAIIYAVGRVNFLFDKSTQPYVKRDEICSYFNVGSSTVSQKAGVIIDMFKMSHFSTEFMTDAMVDEYAEMFAPFIEVMGIKL